MSNEQNNTKIVNKLLDKAKSLPTRAGCYKMLNSQNEIIYIGKAKNLKSRVTSYFNSSLKNSKTEALVKHIRDFEFVLVGNEIEAFVLENTLIKKHRPKYNIRLKDDKSYPYLVVNAIEPFPRLEYMRRIKRNKDTLVFGPFPVGSNISQIIKILTKIFKLRDCSLTEFRKRKEPCLLYQMNQCSAPCVQKISNGEYDRDLKMALGIFQNRKKETLHFIETKMHGFAEAEEFEKAAELRDQLQMIKEFVDYGVQKNVELAADDIDLDIIGFYIGDEIEIAILMIRNGLMIGHKNFSFFKEDVQDDENEEATKYEEVFQFLAQYYGQTHDSLPSKIVCQFEKNERSIFTDALSLILDKKIPFIAPDKYKTLVELSMDQARENYQHRKTNEDSPLLGLNKLKELLNLSEMPRVLECYDIAIFQGDSPTASRIVFHEGRPDKNQYRHYHLEKREEGNNDFAMMTEVITRRLKDGNLPDVFIVDGGKGQVNSFVEVLKEKQIDVPVVGIAKSKTKGDFTETEVEKSEERLIIPGRVNPYILSKNKSLFRIIVSMRDEAHRFSRRLHHHAEKKRLFN